MALSRGHAAVLQIARSHDPALRTQIQSALNGSYNAYSIVVKRSLSAIEAWRDFQPSIFVFQRQIQIALAASGKRVMNDVYDYQIGALGLTRSPAVRGLKSALAGLANSIAAEDSIEITQTTLATALRAQSFYINDGVKGKPKSLAYYLERTKGGIGERRANTIAGNENHIAAQEALAFIAEWLSRNNVGVYQQWKSRRDSKVRPTHRRANGQTVPIGELFQVGDALLRFPGDPEGPAEETINCRCSIVLTTKKPKP